MHPLPFIFALVSAAILAPALLRALSDGGHTRPNYRDRTLPFPFGVLTLAAALLALIPLLLLQRLASTQVLPPELMPVAVYTLGVLALGLLDDTLASDAAGTAVAADAAATGTGAAARVRQRGWRGHGAATLRGELSTGALKAAGRSAWRCWR